MMVKLKASDLLIKNELLHVDLVAMLAPSSVHIGKPPFSRRVRNDQSYTTCRVRYIIANMCEWRAPNE